MKRKGDRVKVVEYLRNTENGLQKLTDEYGIIVKKYPEGLIVLNYDQISSPKQDDMVRECRGLILDNDFNVVSRSLDRFFNYGECFTTFDLKKSTIYEKIDGSLIKIYYWNRLWRVSTRGTAFAESGVNGFSITFKDMVYRALQCDETGFQDYCNWFLNHDYTYICEVTGVENRVVTRYEGYSLWLLATRHNQTGEYYNHRPVPAQMPNVKLPKIFTFNSIEECLEVVKHLPDLQEGYVVYEDGVPVCKIKSPDYVACHLIRADGLSPNRIARLVVLNEQSEYLAYYPEDEVHFAPYVEELTQTLSLADRVYQDTCKIVDQKEFALKVKGYPFSFILFTARRDKENDIYKVFNSFDENCKVKFLLGLMQANG